MAEAAATYPAGMSVTRTTPPAAPPYAYALALMGAQDKYRTDLSNWARMNWRPPVVSRGTNELGAAPVSRPASAPAPAPMRPSGVSADGRTAMQRARDRAELLKMQAAERPPVQYSGGSYGLASMGARRELLSPELMNAYQREMYLPSSAAMQANGLSDSQQLEASENESAWRIEQARAAQAEARAREAEARAAAIARQRYGIR